METGNLLTQAILRKLPLFVGNLSRSKMNKNSANPLWVDLSRVMTVPSYGDSGRVMATAAVAIHQRYTA